MYVELLQNHTDVLEVVALVNLDLPSGQDDNDVALFTGCGFRWNVNQSHTRQQNRDSRLVTGIVSKRCVGLTSGPWPNSK